MLIDWFTVGAQIVNFLILVALLKHFLYGPIIRAMEKRQQQVASLRDEAEEKRRAAEEEKVGYEEQRRELDSRREELFALARQEADELKRELSGQARAEVEEQKHHWREALRQERDAFLRELKRRAGMEVYAVARKALTDLAGTGLEQQMIARFLDRLADLDDQDRERLREAAGRPDGGITVASSFAMTDEDRQRISDRLRRLLADSAAVSFEVDESLICGIELRAHGCLVGWNLEGYLAKLEEDLEQVLAEEASRGAAGETEEGKEHSGGEDDDEPQG